MIGFNSSAKVVIILFILVGIYVFLKVRGKRLRNILEQRFPYMNIIYSVLFYAVVILCIPTGFFLIEIPYNYSLLEMEAYYICLGLALTAVLFLLFFFAGQRTKLSLGFYLGACFIIGVVNHFVTEFKGQPLFPSDVLSFQTAAEVSSLYVYTIGDRILIPLAVCFFFACVLACLPRRKVTRVSVACNCTVAVLVAVCFSVWFSNTDIEERYNCTVNSWYSLESYWSQGMLLCFLQLTQQLTPEVPEDYSSDTALELRSSALSTTEETSEISDETQLPSVVVIMNETFSDLSIYSALEDSYEGLVYFDEIASEALVSGNVYVSSLGGGTCNSEFEFLTGSSIGFLGLGSCPYMLYNFDKADNLVAYMSYLGYETTAIHPNAASNYRRDIVYAQLGFDQFIDISGFEDAETRRDLVTDAEIYDLVLEILTESEEPQFIFNLTIANHSGYDIGALTDEEMLTAVVNGSVDEEVGEYLGCMQYSDQEFAEFIAALEELDQPVIVCIFGDHQPSFVSNLSEISEGVSASAMDIEQTQQRYITPYMIWTNSAELRESQGVGTVRDVSLNYLAADLLQYAGLPLDSYFSFLLEMQEIIPIININGYQDAERQWYLHGDESDSEVSTAYSQLEIVQYDNLFNNDYVAEWY